MTDEDSFGIQCVDGFIWNHSKWEFECDKLCNIGEHLDYKNCRCRNRLIDNLVLECEDEILKEIPLNTTNTISIADENNCLKHFILLIIICLLLKKT